VKLNGFYPVSTGSLAKGNSFYPKGSSLLRYTWQGLLTDKQEILTMSLCNKH